MQKNTSNYAVQRIATALKAAREAKGLTQRALSKRSGVPQAHLSKIESNAVDLRLSSLLALAHSLDLEVALVPRKALPAVQSLSRTVGGSTVAPQISKDLARAQQALVRLQETFNTPELDRLQEIVADITRMQAALSDSTATGEMRKAVEAIRTGEDTMALRRALKQVKALCNALVHEVPAMAAPQRPAYQLEDDADD